MKTKACIACKEEIFLEALKCKHCQQIQTKAANLQNKPAFNYLVIGLLGFLILWIGYHLVQIFIEDPVEPSFTITSSELLVSESDKGLNIRCIAEIKNPTTKRWDEFSLQASFKNASGTVIDVVYSKPDVAVYPLFNFSGIVSGKGSALREEYDSCELSVINADDY